MSPSSTENKVRPTGTYAQGDTIAGRFVITRLLGEGGMGKVYVAKQQPMGRKIALKVMRGDLTGEDAAVKRFFREALAVSKLHHPNTVTLFDYGQTLTLLARTLGELAHFILHLSYLSFKMCETVPNLSRRSLQFSEAEVDLLYEIV